MRKFLALVFAVFFCGMPAARGNMMLVPTGGGGGGGYSGPGDVVAGAPIWYGLRGYSAAVAAPGTQKSITIRRASDNATQDLVILSTGALDVATATTFCAATTCFVTTLYDQSGANSCSAAPCNLAQATTGKQPQLLLSGCPGTNPCMHFVASNVDQLTGLTPTIVNPWTLVAVVDDNKASGSSQWFYSTAGSGSGFYCAACSNPSFGLRLYSGGSVFLAEYDTHQSALNSVIGVSSSSAVIYINAVSAATGSQSAGWTAGPIQVGDDGEGDSMDGYLEEAGVWPVAFSSGQATNMCHNQYAFWGTAVSC